MKCADARGLFDSYLSCIAPLAWREVIVRKDVRVKKFLVVLLVVGNACRRG